MRRNIAVNVDATGCARALRACYAQCGFDSVFRTSGHGISGVKVIYEV